MILIRGNIEKVNIFSSVLCVNVQILKINVPPLPLPHTHAHTHCSPGLDLSLFLSRIRTHCSPALSLSRLTERGKENKLTAVPIVTGTITSSPGGAIVTCFSYRSIIFL